MKSAYFHKNAHCYSIQIVLVGKPQNGGYFWDCDWKEHKGILQGDGNVLCLNKGLGYIGACIC